MFLEPQCSLLPGCLLIQLLWFPQDGVVVQGASALPF